MATHLPRRLLLAAEGEDLWTSDNIDLAAEESAMEDAGMLEGGTAAEAMEELQASPEHTKKGASSKWPTFGIVGEKQAALYYTSFLVFTALFLKNSAGAARGQQALRKSTSGSSR